MMTYPVQYWAAWIVAAVGIVAAALTAASLTIHPSWLTQDVAATAGIVATVCVGLAALLPQLTRTPAVREAKYLSAMAGDLPADIKEKTALMVTRDDDTLNVSTPEVPPPA